MKENDTWTLDGHTFSSRFILGSGKFSLPLIEAAIKGAGAEMVTLALRRVNTGGKANIMDYISFPTHQVPETLTKPYASPVFPEKSAIRPLSRSRS